MNDIPTTDSTDSLNSAGSPTDEFARHSPMSADTRTMEKSRRQNAPRWSGVPDGLSDPESDLNQTDAEIKADVNDSPPVAYGDVDTTDPEHKASHFSDYHEPRSLYGNGASQNRFPTASPYRDDVEAVGLNSSYE